jgi:tRNA-splicing endonuclease subunit Sen15
MSVVEVVVSLHYLTNQRLDLNLQSHCPDYPDVKCRLQPASKVDPNKVTIMMTSSPTTTSPPPAPDPHHLDVLQIVHTHLLHQADWQSLTTHASPPLPRPLISGIPPESSHREWVLPVNLREKWAVRKWAEFFDALPEQIGSGGEGGGPKKVVMGVVSDDSTVVYYVVHDGIVKPKQN